MELDENPDGTADSLPADGLFLEDDATDPEQAPWGWISWGCYGPVMLASLTLLWFRDPGGLASLQVHVVGTAPGRGLLAGLAIGVAVVGFSRLLSWQWSAARRMEATFTRLLGPLSERHCLLLAGTSAVGEELLFRAVLQPHLGLVTTSLLFGLLHLPFERSLFLWTPFAVAMGFLLGWQYQSTGTLMAPIATHFLINWLNLLRVRRLSGSLAIP